MKAGFYGSAWADVTARENGCGIRTPQELYEALMNCWCAETCAPRMRDTWSLHHPTWGQCSITAFLVQDLFGGRVRGVELEDGSIHCFNEVPRADGSLCVFDLTSEQFGDRILSYENCPEQFRAVHFRKAEKKERYFLLKHRLFPALMDVHVLTRPALELDMGCEGSVTMIPFSGTVSGPLLEGVVEDGGVDTQTVNAAGIRHMSARYMLRGRLRQPYGEGTCRIFVENEGWSDWVVPMPFRTKPRFMTDHPDLRRFLQEREWTGEGSMEEDGLHIRFYRT